VAGQHDLRLVPLPVGIRMGINISGQSSSLVRASESRWLLKSGEVKQAFSWISSRTHV